MIRISVEVGSGTARFEMTVRAESIEQAMDLVRACYPGSEVKVLFPIAPEAFFVSEKPLPVVGPIPLEMAEAG